MAQAKITINDAQAKALGLLVYHKKVNPFTAIMFEPKSGINLRQTRTGEYIEIPDGVDISNLRNLQRAGYFTVIDGVIEPQAQYDPIFQSISIGGVGDTMLSLHFNVDMYMLGDIASTGLGQDTDDMVILVDGTAKAFTIGAIPRASATKIITIDLGAKPASSVSVKFNATGLAKICNVDKTLLAASNARTYDMKATDFTTFSLAAQTGSATINGLNHTVAITVAAGTNVTALVSTFTLSGGATAKVGSTAQVSGTTANNFTSPVTYTITAHDGTTTQAWTVTVTVAS
jgi:hypothetical protein